MVALHLALMLRRLAREGEPGRRLGQALVEAFVVDMDDILREMTIGDLAVPREVKRAVAAIHDRHRDYDAALAAGDAALATELQARLGADIDSGKLGAYVREADAALARLGAADLRGGRIDWPRIEAQADASGARAH